ncbi:unnamed protein product [Phaedon cochleariae]|uniref:Uncharacterized protein n=1 Tax=Phaedon cochleariae TaxID=80249 RepID=A0A9N9X4C4_PHACE|nr:unnamed protein product [Phaedon cochleariae]
MKYLLISLSVIIGVGSIKLDGPKHEVTIDINNTTVTDAPITDIVPVDSTTEVPSTTTAQSTTSHTTSTVTPSTTKSTSIAPNVTTLAPNVTTVPPIPPTNSTVTTIRPSNGTTPISTSTVKPSVPTTPPVPEHHRRFDGPSFVGGIVLALGLVAIGFVAFKFYKARTELNYHTL